MPQSLFLRRSATLLLISISLNASAHGLNPTLEAIVAIASIERCSDEHPSMRSQLAKVGKTLDEKIDNLHLSAEDRIEYRKAKELWRSKVQEGSGPSTEPECRLLVRGLQLTGADLDAEEPDQAMEPEAIALVFGVSKACEAVIPGYTARLARQLKEEWDQKFALSRKYEGSSDFRHMVDDVYKTKNRRPRPLLVEECEESLL
jgi:hypothetical protein